MVTFFKNKENNPTPNFWTIVYISNIYNTVIYGRGLQFDP